MGTLIAAVLAASLLGSLHCAAMCGPIAAFAVMATPGQPMVQYLLPQLAYHGGRLVTYAVLGALAGLLGAALDQGGALVGVQRAATVAAGVIMIALGGAVALQSLGVRIRTPSAPAALARRIGAAHAAASRQPAVLRALTVGLLTGLLPCGWLYAFVVAAAGTGSAAHGAVTLAAFWAGTLPVLAALGAGVQRLLGLVGARLQLAGALIVVVLGIASLIGRWDARMDASTRHVGTPASVENATRQVETMHDTEAPCCEHDR